VTVRPSLGPTINALPIFSALTMAEAEDLGTHCQVVRLDDGERLFSEGDAAADLFVVISGQLRVSCKGPEGVEVVVGMVGAGDVVGEMGVLDPAPRSATTTSLGGTVALRLAGVAFSAMIDTGHPAAWSIIREIRREACARMRTVDARVDALFHVEPTPQESSSGGGLAERVRAVWLALRGTV